MVAEPVRYLVDEQGERVAVVVPIEEYEALMRRAERAVDESELSPMNRPFENRDRAKMPPSLRRSVTLAELVAEQGTQPLQRIEQLHGDFWPEQESVDEFIAAVRHWRRGDDA